MVFNLMAVSCVTFSLGPILIDYAVGGAIAIAHGDRDGGDEDGRDGVRRAAKSGGYCVAKTTHPAQTLALRVLQHPLRPVVPVRFNANRQYAVHAAETATMVD